jgi:hypothetical protein
MRASAMQAGLTTRTLFFLNVLSSTSTSITSDAVARVIDHAHVVGFVAHDHRQFTQNAAAQQSLQIPVNV